MKYSSSQTFAGAMFLAMANAHGLLKSPQPRMPGQAMAAACGQQVYNNQASDPYGNIQGEMQVAANQKDYDPTKCNLNICKGFQFGDANSSTIQKFTAGQVVPMTFDIRAPHTGVANVSVVDTAANKPIGSPLISWPVFASVQSSIPADELNFQVTIPDLGFQCSQAGACVIQHWWDAASINQTYESCIDFTINGGSGGAVPTSASASASPKPSPVSISTTLATSLKAAATPTATTEPDDGECEDEPEDGGDGCDAE